MGGLNAAPAGAFPPRAEALARLQAQEWDLVVVGGGISGAGVAQQAAQQGWRVLLVEQRDFAWGTSSRSSKLVHGGLRYLQQGDLRTTRDCVRERERLLREAPGLVVRQSFLFPDCAGRAPGRWLVQAGLTLYDLLAGQRSHFHAGLAATHMLAPGLALPRLRGALVFHDAQTDDARLVLRVLQEARRHGATTLSYVAAQALLRTQGRVTGLALRDALAGRDYTVRARCVVNATGAWADRLRGHAGGMDGAGGAPLLRPLRGSHLLLPWWRLPVAQSISFLHPQDGRPVFLYPWEGATLIGTTDLDHAGPLDAEARITPAEVDYLLDAARTPFPHAALTAADIQACYAGVRPVVGAHGQPASRAPREHLVRDEGGLITLTGGKLTTFRPMAQDALARAAPHVGRPFARSAAPLFASAGPLPAHWPPAVRQRLLARYGALAPALCAALRGEDLQCIPGTHTLWAELPLAARHEAVEHLDDLLLRRTRLGLLVAHGALGLLPRIRALCAPHLGWSGARWAQETARYRALVAAHYQPPGATLPEFE
ncbi:glycerol-3-phosphate dehydrogenase/oxidase [Acidovorax sp. YS12]|nr:glycerol-3-phosphate dehydrogenase/oxidase [Acidovorax sp. YS12]